VQQKS